MNTGPTGSNEEYRTGMESTGPTGIERTMIFEVIPPPPEILTLADLISDTQIVLAKELADKALLETIAIQSVHSLRPILVEWVMKGCPNAYPILRLDIRPPATCSDGEVRNLTDYILFCSGKSIRDHAASLQAKLPDIDVSFANFGGITTIVVTKP